MTPDPNACAGCDGGHSDHHPLSGNEQAPTTAAAAAAAYQLPETPAPNASPTAAPKQATDAKQRPVPAAAATVATTAAGALRAAFTSGRTDKPGCQQFPDTLQTLGNAQGKADVTAVNLGASFNDVATVEPTILAPPAITEAAAEEGEGAERKVAAEGDAVTEQFQEPSRPNQVGSQAAEQVDMVQQPVTDNRAAAATDPLAGCTSAELLAMVSYPEAVPTTRVEKTEWIQQAVAALSELRRRLKSSSQQLTNCDAVSPALCTGLAKVLSETKKYKSNAAALIRLLADASASDRDTLLTSPANIPGLLAGLLVESEAVTVVESAVAACAALATGSNRNQSTVGSIRGIISNLKQLLPLRNGNKRYATAAAKLICHLAVSSADNRNRFRNVRVVELLQQLYKYSIRDAGELQTAAQKGKSLAARDAAKNALESLQVQLEAPDGEQPAVPVAVIEGQQQAGEGDAVGAAPATAGNPEALQPAAADEVAKEEHADKRKRRHSSDGVVDLRDSP